MVGDESRCDGETFWHKEEEISPVSITAEALNESSHLCKSYVALIILFLDTMVITLWLKVVSSLIFDVRFK